MALAALSEENSDITFLIFKSTRAFADHNKAKRSSCNEDAMPLKDLLLWKIAFPLESLK